MSEITQQFTFNFPEEEKARIEQYLKEKLGKDIKIQYPDIKVIVKTKA